MSTRAQAISPYLLVIAFGAAALVQVALLPALKIGGVAPNLILDIVVAQALLQGTRAALVWALIGGLWLDLLSGGPFGMYTLGLLAAAWVTGIGGRTVYRNHLLLTIAMVLAATVAQGLVHLVMLSLANGIDGLDLPALARVLALEGLVNAGMMLFVYPLVAWVDRVTGQERLPLE